MQRVNGKKETSNAYDIKGKEKTSNTPKKKEKSRDGYAHMNEYRKHLLYSTHECAC